MAEVSSSSNVVFGTALITIAILVLLLLRHYLPLRSTPAYLLLPVFLALFLPASIILLVPIDLASSVTGEDGSPKGVWLPQRALLVLWRIAYWLTFVLTWVILPLLGDYADSGHREPKERLVYSLRTNIRYQLMVLASAIAGLVYFFISSGVEVHSLKAMVMALAYAWGLVLAIYLMGHGLVAIPRKLYRNASVSGRLRRLQSGAPRLYERMTDSMEGLQALETQVLMLRQRKTGTARDFQEWIDELVESSDLPEARIVLDPSYRQPEGTIPAVITERYLADLTRKLKRARHSRIRFVEEWDYCVRQAQWLQAILDASGSKRLEAAPNADGATWLSKRSLQTQFTRYHLHANILPGIRLFLASIFSLASASIIWTEIVSRPVPSLSIISYTIAGKPSTPTHLGLPAQFTAALWLLYMTSAALISISEVKVWGNRALVRRHTYAESACWYASLVARLTVPLSYNFITFLPASVYEQTTFFQFLGNLIVLTPLGTGFSAFFPMLILLPVLATAFNLYGRISDLTGFGAMEDETDADGGMSSWQEGKRLIDREVSGVNAVGLASRDPSPRPRPGDRSTTGASKNAARHPAVDTGLLAPYSDEPSTATSATTSTTAGPTRVLGSTTRPSRNAPRGAVQEEDDIGNDSGFFSDFAHRVRNTLDTVDKPDWIKNVDFKKPKWMGPGNGNASASGNGNSTAGTRNGNGNGLQRWFGRGGEGGVRI